MRTRALAGRGVRALQRVDARIRRSTVAVPYRRATLLAHGRSVRWGNLRRTQPFCGDFGLTRGTPVDRHYIDAFIRSNRALLAGDVMEVQEPYYIRMFGCPDARAHIVDIDATNPEATIVADLCRPGALPATAFDTIVLTQVLQLLPELRIALENLHDALRPGGHLLMTVPTMGKLAYDLAPRTDFWRWTPDGLRVLLESTLPGTEWEVGAGGNVLTCISYLMGLAVEDLRPADLAADDPVHPLIVTAHVRRPVEPRAVRG